jgi:hypothetical protein
MRVKINHALNDKTQYHIWELLQNLTDLDLQGKFQAVIERIKSVTNDCTIVSWDEFVEFFRSKDIQRV